VAVDQFAERLAIVRHRFVSASKARSKTRTTRSHHGRRHACRNKATAESFRRIHGIVGVGRRLDFPRAVDLRVLPRMCSCRHTGGTRAKCRRALSFKKTLHALQAALQAECRSPIRLAIAALPGAPALRMLDDPVQGDFLKID